MACKAYLSARTETVADGGFCYQGLPLHAGCYRSTGGNDEWALRCLLVRYAGTSQSFKPANSRAREGSAVQSCLP